MTTVFPLSFSLQERIVYEEQEYARNKEAYENEKHKYQHGLWVIYHDGKLLKCVANKDVILDLISSSSSTSMFDHLRGYYLTQVNHDQ